jgi:hypothetical protein
MRTSAFSLLLLATGLTACTESLPDRVEDSTGCIWRNDDPGDNGPEYAYGRALAGAGTLYVAPESGPRAGNSYTVRWDSGSSQETETDDSGRIPIALGELEAGEQTARISDRRGDEVIQVLLTLVEPGTPAVICAGAVEEDGSAQEPGDFDDPLTLRAWTQEAQGLELLLWVYEFDQGIFTSSSQTVASDRQILEQDNVTVTVETSFPSDMNEIGGLELAGLARLFDADGEQVGEDVQFPVTFEW